jgi:hypothetical protein
MRVHICEERRMLRALHPRWPYRRSHSRHDLHWLVRVRRPACWCGFGRAHLVRALAPVHRRPLDL